MAQPKLVPCRIIPGYKDDRPRQARFAQTPNAIIE